MKLIQSYHRFTDFFFFSTMLSHSTDNSNGLEQHEMPYHKNARNQQNENDVIILFANTWIALDNMIDQFEKQFEVESCIFA